MSFFLIGRESDGHIFLLSDSASETRQDALSELSRVTADPGFAHWDAEVFVLDIAQGTPVLLVRSAPAQATPEPEAEPQPEPVAEPEVESEPEVEPESEPEPEPEPEVEPEHDDAAEAELAEVLSGLEDDAEDDTDIEEPDEAITVEAAELDEPEESEQVDAAYAEAVLEESQESSLKDALLRTAASMSAEGIVPPESVGPAEEPSEPASVDEADESPDPTQPQAWPWDTGSPAEGESAAFNLDALEESSSDEGSLVKAAGDDETMAASRPVILGAYGETPVAEPSTDPAPVAQEPMSSAEEIAPEESAADIVTEILAAATNEESTPETRAPEPSSDFILDLDELAATSATDDASGYVAGDAAVPTTCNDCVYVETCPHTGQRSPQSCGSFQWK